MTHETLPNASRINLHKDYKKLDDDIKDHLKTIFNAIYTESWMIPLCHKNAVDSFLQKHGINFTLSDAYLDFYDMTPEEQKIERTRMEKKMVDKEGLKLMEQFRHLLNSYNEIWKRNFLITDFSDHDWQHILGYVSQDATAEERDSQEKSLKALYDFWQKVHVKEEQSTIKTAIIQCLKNSCPESSVVLVGGIYKRITDPEALYARFAQLEAPGQPCVIIHRPDAQPITCKDFASRLSGDVVVTGTNQNGQPTFVKASTYWTGSAKKHIYTSIVFTNKVVSPYAYNLFTGFGIKPKQGMCEGILGHVREVICAGDEKNYNAFLDLLSWQIQNIGTPSRIITALKSTVQQAGKGTLCQDILAHIYGNSGFVTSDMDKVITRFNDTLRGKAYIFLDEALFSGDRKAADAIKSLATTTRVGIESKGIPVVQVPIAVNLFLATNHDDAAHIEEADSRYWILEVSPHRAGDADYFKELYQEIETGGREAFMHLLLNRDVTNFVPSHDVPKDNKFKDAMIQNSINPYDARKWIEACCEAEMLLGCKPKDKESPFPNEQWVEDTEYNNGIFQTSYAEWQKNLKSPTSPRPTPLNKFGELLNNLGFFMRIQGGVRYRRLPRIDYCKQKLKETPEMDKK